MARLSKSFTIPARAAQSGIRPASARACLALQVAYCWCETRMPQESLVQRQVNGAETRKHQRRDNATRVYG